MPRAKSTEHKYTSARDRAEQQKAGFEPTHIKVPQGVELFKPKSGVMLIDILPFVAGEGNPWAEPGALHWEREYYAHRAIGANQDTYICPRMTAKQKCPICEYRGKLMREGSEENESLIADLAPKRRQLFNVIDRKAPDKGVQIWDISYHLFGKLLDARIKNADEEDDWERFFFLEDGLTIRVAFEEKSYGSFNYMEAATIDFKPRKTPYEKSILKQTHCLDDLLIVTPYDELKKIFLNVEDEDGGKPAKPAKKPTKKPVDEEEEEEEDDEEEEVKKPAKKVASKPSKKPVVEEEEEDDWEGFDDEEEEEEVKKPAKKVASKPAAGKKKPVVEDEEEEEEEPAKPAKKKVASKPSKKPVVEDEEEEEEEDDEEPVKPAKKKKADSVKKPAKKEEEEEEDDDWGSFEDEDEDEDAD